MKARLVLVGRSAFPERDKWEQWLACHGAQDTITCKIRRLQALEQSGAQVMTVTADVSDIEAMRKMICRAIDRFGKINGVIHSAGVAGKGIVQLKTPESVASVFAPKIKGVLVLETLLKDTELDFFVMCSSLSSTKARLGQVDYSGANAFLDAFSQSNRFNNGRSVISIDWDTWLGVGMTANTDPHHDYQEPPAGSLKAILPEEGADAFSRILGGQLSRVIVSPADVPAMMQASDDSRPRFRIHRERTD